MGNQQTHRHRNRITPLQQDNIASTTSNIIPLDSENSFIIWLEIPLKNRTNHGESVELRHRLRQVFPHIQSFCDFQTCINHIKNARLNCDQRFILIFSGLIARSRVMSFYNIPSVALIYFCVYSENDLFYNWINCNNNKIRGLFNNIDSLYNQLINDVRVDNYKVFLSLPITVFSNDGAETSTRTINADYLWLQLLIEMIINMNHTEQAKEQMFKLCFLHYQNDANGLKALEKFRSTYMSDQAICWYTADSFMYRLLNKALRYPENFDNVFKFRYFIADLHRQLKTIHHNFSAKIVYRGQMISAQELNMFKENCGKCISVNTFLSTTFDEEVAKLYAGNGQQRPKLESVLFVIHINDTIPNNKPFASIKDYTKFKDEEEVLFSIGSMFEILEHIELIAGTNIWKIELKLTSIENQHVVKLMNHFLDELYGDIDVIILSNFLIYMGKYKEAEDYIKDIYNSCAHKDKHILFAADLAMSLGLVYHNQFHYIEAERIYKIVLNYGKYQRTLNHLKCQSLLGKLYVDEKQYDMAAWTLGFVISSLENYEQKNQKKYYLLLAETYINLASVYIEADDSYEFESKKVFDLLSLSKEIYDKFLPENHPLFVQLYYYIGWAYFKEDSNDVRALENFQKAMNIQILSLPRNHLQRVKIHFHLGKFCFAQKQYSKSLEEFGKILDIQSELLDELRIPHPLLAETFEIMGSYYLKMHRFIQAFLYFRLAQELNPNEQLKDILELDIEVCKIAIQHQVDTFAMHDIMNALGGTNQYVREDEILFNQDLNENILDMASELRSMDVRFADFGNKVIFREPLTLQQMRVVSDFIRNGSSIQCLTFYLHPCIDSRISENILAFEYLANALAVNNTITELDIRYDVKRSKEKEPRKRSIRKLKSKR